MLKYKLFVYLYFKIEVKILFKKINILCYMHRGLTATGVVTEVLKK